MSEEVLDRLVNSLEEGSRKMIKDENSFTYNFIFKEEMKEFEDVLTRFPKDKRQQFVNACFMLDFAGRIKEEKCIGVKFVLVFTAVESIMGNSDYEDFQHWIGKIKKEDCRIKAKDFEKAIRDLTEEYNNKFGVIRHVKEFFKKYASEEEKKLIVSSVYSVRELNKIKVTAPYCFICNDKCFDGNPDNCIKEKNPDCKLNSLELDIFLDKCIGLLYNVFRNKFIHSGARGYFIDNNPNTISHSFGYREDSKWKEFGIKEPLNFNKFYEIVFNGVKRYFETELRGFIK